MSILSKSRLQAMLAVFFLTSQSLAVERKMDIDYESPIFAERGQTAMTVLDVHARLEQMPEEAAMDVMYDPKQLRLLAESILSTQFFAEKAINEGFMEDPLVQAQMHQAVISLLATLYRNSVLEENLLDDYDQQARELYLQSQENYMSQGQVSFTHILIANEKENAQSTAEALKDRIESGENITELAIEFSDDPSKVENNGTFTQIGLNQLDSGFRQGIESLSNGSLSVIESSFGWHVVQVIDLEPPSQLPFENVKDDLISQAKQKHQEEIMSRMLREAYSETLIIRDGAVEKMIQSSPR